MSNRCGECIMANCCKEFARIRCSEVREYGEAIKARVIEDAIEPIMKIEEDAKKYGLTDAYELVQIRRYLEQLKEKKE